MATATINGLEVTLTIAELIEFANSSGPVLTGRISTEPVEVPSWQPENKKPAPKQVAEMPKQGDKRYSVDCKCVSCGNGFTIVRNSPRGRKPAKCNSCKGIETPQNDAPKQDAPKQNFRNNGGRRKFDKAKWLASPEAQEDMSDKQERAIRRMLNTRNVTAKSKTDIEAALVRLPKITKAQASALMDQLFKMPKIEA